MGNDDVVSNLAYMMRSAQLGGANYGYPLRHPMYPIDRYDDIGSRYWGWPDANEFGNGLQSVGKEPRGTPR